MNPNQQFCLRWNNHQSTLISVFEALLESGTLVDCTLAAEGQYLKAHKVVLSACSPYLGMLLSQDFEKHPILILKDVKFAQLKSMLDYMYRGEVNISQDQLGTFLKAAESLQIKGLTDSGNANSNNSNNSGEDDYNARHRKHLALMAAAAARARSPIIEQQQQQHQHTRWMNNGGSMHEMMRDGSISPSPRRRKRPRRPSLSHNPLQNGHDDMPLQPLIQQAQATTNNVLAQSLAAPPLTHPPKCVSPPRPVTPPVIENHREEEEASSPSPKPQPMIEHNNNVNHLLLKQEKILNSSPDHKDNGVLTNNNNSNMNNNHSNSVDGGVSDDDGGSDNEERGERMKKDEAMDEENNEELEEEGEEDLDEDSRSAHVQGATMANAHWLMAEASLPNSDSFQDSKVEVREEIQKIKLVQQDKLIATPSSQQTTSVSSTTTATNLPGSTLKILANNNLVQGGQLKGLLTSPGNQQLKLLNPLQLNALSSGQTRQIYLTNISRFITINPQKPTALILADQSAGALNVNTTSTTSVATTVASASGNISGSSGITGTSNEVLSCNMCGKKYQWKQSLTRHIREHRCAKGPQHSCPCCNLSFKHTSSLNKHVMLCTAVHSRLQQAQGTLEPGVELNIKDNHDSDVQEINDEEDDMMEDDNDESCDNNDAIVGDSDDNESDDPLS